MKVTQYTAPNVLGGTVFRRVLRGAALVLGRVGFGLCLWLSAQAVQADNSADVTTDITTDNTAEDLSSSKVRLDLRRPSDASFGAAWDPYGQAQHYPQTRQRAARRPAALSAAQSAAQSASQFRLVSSGLKRHQVDQGTRMTGWKLGDEVFFGRSKGDLSGVALIWQRSQTDQVSLSGSGLRLTRRIN